MKQTPTEQTLAARVSRGILGVLPERWRQRLEMLKGLFVGDGVEQLGRLMAVMRHFGDYRRVERALYHHRYAVVLLLAYRVGLFEVLAERTGEITEIAKWCDLPAEVVQNLLMILQTQGWVERNGNRWRATEPARALLCGGSAASMVPMFQVAESYATAFPDLVEAASTGETPSILDVFDDSGRTDDLLDGVNHYIDQAGRELISRVDWPEIRHFIVGSMGVSFSALVLDQFSDSRVTYGCLPHLVERIPRLREEYGVEPDRVVETHPHGGEPAEDKWGREAFDLVFLTKKMILDPENDLGEKFASKAYRVLEPGGVTVFWETIYEDDGSSSVDRGLEGFLDFGVSPTGPSLTRGQFRRRLERIGYGDVEVVDCLQGATTFVVARKTAE